MNRPHEKPGRNVELTLRALGGESRVALAAAYGVTRGRVSEIAHRICERADPDLYARVVPPGSMSLAVLAASAAGFVERIGGRENE